MVLLRNKFRIFWTLLFGLLFAVPIAGQETILFEDEFDGTLQPGWEWRRENPSGHRFADGGLEIEAEPFAENEAKNVLVRPFPVKENIPFRIEAEVTCLTKPTNQYQQGGIYWLKDGRVAFKLVHEFVDGQTYIYPGKIPVDSETVNLRIISNGNDVIAEYSCRGEGSYRRVYEGKLVRGEGDEIGVQCWHGPENTEQVPWYRFKRFRVIKTGE